MSIISFIGFVTALGIGYNFVGHILFHVLSKYVPGAPPPETVDHPSFKEIFKAIFVTFWPSFKEMFVTFWPSFMLLAIFGFCKVCFLSIIKPRASHAGKNAELDLEKIRAELLKITKFEQALQRKKQNLEAQLEPAGFREPSIQLEAVVEIPVEVSKK